MHLPPTLFFARRKIPGLPQFRRMPLFSPVTIVFSIKARTVRENKQREPKGLPCASKQAKRAYKARVDNASGCSRQRNRLPFIFNVCNSAKAPDGKPIVESVMCAMLTSFAHSSSFTVSPVTGLAKGTDAKKTALRQ